ncbi:MAG: TonB family protein [Burkholderiales bacterium]|nr:TonB family protein [Burkholderiales bacterium]
MDYAQQQRSPGKHLTGIVAVLILHIVLGYALLNGLATKVMEVIKKPTETKIIEEVKKLPPPDTPPPPPPKMVQVLPTFVPPPEVMVQAPVVAPIISNRTAVAPPVYAPPAPPAPPAPVAAPSVGVACPNSQEIRTNIKYPVQARKDGLQGEVLIEMTIAANGEVKDVEIKSSSNRAFNAVSIAASRQFKCNGQGRDVRVQVPYSFKLVD